MKKESMTINGVEIVVTISDNGETNIDVKGSNVNINYNDTKVLVVESKSNLAKIYNFIANNKYDGDEPEEKNNEKGITLCINGFEFYAHWREYPNKDTKILELNDFVPSYTAISEKLNSLDKEIREKFPDDSYYETTFNVFKDSLKDIDINIYSNGEDEFSTLMTFVLPAIKLEDDGFINEFINIFSAYDTVFDDELNTIA